MPTLEAIVARAVLVAAALLAICPFAARAQGSRAAGEAPGAFLQLDDTKLYYEECGTAPLTVVLLHDGVVNSAAWDGVWPELCRHFGCRRLICGSGPDSRAPAATLSSATASRSGGRTWRLRWRARVG
jgi:hypothetical protein